MNGASILCRVRICGGIDEEKEAERELSDPLASSSASSFQTYQSAGEVDASCANIGATQPFWLGESEKSVAAHCLGLEVSEGVVIQKAERSGRGGQFPASNLANDDIANSKSRAAKYQIFKRCEETIPRYSTFNIHLLGTRSQIRLPVEVDSPVLHALVSCSASGKTALAMPQPWVAMGQKPVLHAKGPCPSY